MTSEKARQASNSDRLPINNVGAYCAFRSFGSRGLVIFQREGTLLERKPLCEDFLLSDVSNQFIEMLRQLRELKFRFGFMSIDRGMEAFSRGGSEFAALTGLLDQLLAMRGAMPDFWMAWREFPQGNGTEFPHRNAVRQIPDSRMIRRAADWYEVDKEETVYVSSSATGLVAARDMDEIHVPYFDPHEPPDEAMQLDRLLLRIQQILGLGDHRTD